MPLWQFPGPILNKEIDQKYKKRKDTEIQRIVMVYDNAKKCFVINKRHFMLRENDLNIIFGIEDELVFV